MNSLAVVNSDGVTTRHSVAKEELPLEPMQAAFVREFIEDSSSIRAAAIRAGYSISTASQQASRLLQDPRVKHAINEANKQAIKTLGLSAERVLQELWRVASANPGDVITIDELGEASVNARHAGEVVVNTISDGKDKRVKSVTSKTVKPADKIAALSQIAKIMDLFPKEDSVVEVKLTLSELVERSMVGDTKATAEID